MKPDLRARLRLPAPLERQWEANEHSTWHMVPLAGPPPGDDVLLWPLRYWCGKPRGYLGATWVGVTPPESTIVRTCKNCHRIASYDGTR